MTLDHVALTVSDVERSAEFYGRHFGMTERVHQDPHLLILSHPLFSPLLALSAGVPVAKVLPRTQHFGFRASTREEVEEARARFAAHGVVETEWQDDPGFFVRCQVEDPDGYLVEVYAQG